MITLIAEVNVKQGMMDKAQGVIREIISNMLENEPGTLEYTAFTVAGEGNESRIFFYEKYKDEEANRIHHENLTKRMSDLEPVLDFSTMQVKRCIQFAGHRSYSK
jgi:quinol monooxygenase YgiN